MSEPVTTTLPVAAAPGRAFTHLVGEATREMEVLLCCADATPAQDTVDRLRGLIRAGVRWDSLLEQAAWHGMLPLLYRQLRSQLPDDVPSEILGELRARTFAVARRNLLLTAELGEVLGLLTTHRIPALAFKGPVLAQQAYGDVSLREFGDLDILVHEENVTTACAVLLRRGYRPVRQLWPAAEAVARARDGQVMLARGDMVVDLHWRLTPPTFLLGPDRQLVWKRSVRVTLGSIEVQTLSPEDTLLFLCCHGAKHFWLNLEWVCALARLLQRGDAGNPAAVLTEAQRLRCERVVLLGLLLARDLCSAPLPPVVERRIHAVPAVGILARRLYRSLLDEDASLLGVFAELRLSLQLYDGWRERAWYCLQLTTRPHDVDLRAVSLPGWLHGLYPVLRPARLVGKYLQRAIRQLGRRVASR